MKKTWFIFCRTSFMLQSSSKKLQPSSKKFNQTVIFLQWPLVRSWKLAEKKQGFTNFQSKCVLKPFALRLLFLRPVFLFVIRYCAVSWKIMPLSQAHKFFITYTASWLMWELVTSLFIWFSGYEQRILKWTIVIIENSLNDKNSSNIRASF